LIILSVSRASTRDDIAYQLRRFSRSLDRRIQDCRQCP
jgi:hypothetical protein